MKAVLLAAGRGERLGKLTERTPKCLLEVGGITMLEHWLRRFAAAGVEQVFVNTHHLHDQVAEALAGPDVPEGLSVCESYELELLGTAGALFALLHELGPGPFLVANCDTFVQMDLGHLVRWHEHHGLPATMTVHARTEAGPEWGLCEVGSDAACRVKSIDRSHARTGDTCYVDAGLYVFSREALTGCHEVQRDIRRDLLPKLVERKELGAAILWAGGYVLDVGTPENLARARADAEGDDWPWAYMLP